MSGVTATRPGVPHRVARVLGAILLGIVIGMTAANVWPVLLLSLGAPAAAAIELVFLAAYIYWVAGGGSPRKWRAFRADCFRARALAPRDWLWGLMAAISFAATIHASIVLLFRFVPYPAEAFHRGYDFSFIPSRSLQWLACVFSAISAAVCEETGFRGYMQRPIERRIGPTAAILISSLFFTLVHLNKSWALIGMVPIVFGAGLLLGSLARASASLVFNMIGHAIMDVGLFAYWWTQIAGKFPQQPISQTGIDRAFVLECAAFVLFLWLTLLSIRKLSAIRTSS
ncbi:MAG TPA: type II CAAX endopeptidase family protein [Terracidiphilus sp.]|nr:type II CAAX endopeptidase family protein [Terracidiphilus sp.]